MQTDHFNTNTNMCLSSSVSDVSLFLFFFQWDFLNITEMQGLVYCEETEDRCSPTLQNVVLVLHPTGSSSL